MKPDWEIITVVGGILMTIGLLIGLIAWSSQQFADRCERAGGINIDYQACIPAGTPILMTQ